MPVLKLSLGNEKKTETGNLGVQFLQSQSLGMMKGQRRLQITPYAENGPDQKNGKNRTY